MKTNAVILESDLQTAMILQSLIEPSSRIKCALAHDFDELVLHLKNLPDIHYIFCVYDVSSNEEQVREQGVVEYVRRRYPLIKVCSIGSIKREEVTTSDRKVLLFKNSDSDELTCRSNKRKERFKAKSIKRSGATKKQGMYVV